MTSTPSVIGALRVVLGADTAQLDSAFKDTIDKAAKFGKQLATVGGVAAGAFNAVGAAVAAAIAGSLSSIDQLGKTAQQIGVPVEKLSELKFAAEQSGVSLGTLAQGFKDLAGKMSEAVGDKQSGPARAFAAIGVAVTDAAGKLRASDQVMLDVADRFKGLKDDAGKTTLAVQMFGEAGAQMIPMLNRGRDGISELTSEARSLGVVIDADTAAAAARFTNNLKEMGKAKDSLATVLSARLAPALERLSEQFVGYVRNVAKSEETTAFLVGSFKVLASTIQFVATGLDILGIAWSRMRQKLTESETPELAAERWASMWSAIRESGRAGLKENEIIWSGWTTTVSRAVAESTKAASPLIESANQMAERLAVARAELTALVNAPTQDFAAKMIAIQAAVKQGIIPVSQEIGMTNQVLAQMRTEARATLDELVNAPLETYANKMAAVRAALQDGTINMREFGKTTKQINEQNVEHMHALASAVSSALTTIFGKSKAAAIAAAVINTAQAVTKNLAQYPMPLGGVMAGLAVATGAAQIAAIKSANVNGGGSVPRSVPTAPTPSEPASGSGAGAGGLNQTLTVTGLDAGQLFGGEAVRRLADKLLDYQRNGGRVVLGGLS